MSNFTPPSTTNTNNEYIIATILTDPDLSSLFTLSKYNQEWNKASLIKTIQDILANGTSSTNPLIPQTHTINPDIYKKNGTDSIKTIDLNANNQVNQNSMTISDNNLNVYNLVNTENDYDGYDGNITLNTNNNILINDSDINVVYNIPKTIKDTVNGNDIISYDGPQKCLTKTLCTEKHFYKPNCQTVKNADGNCSCNCSPEEVFNESGKPHTHCMTKDLSNSIINYLQDISSIQFNYSKISYDQSNAQSITYDPDIDYLSNLIADYYILLLQNQNKETNKDKINLTYKSNDQSKHQLYEDANEMYKETYTKIVNISVGIVMSSCIIYAILQK
jgi:hypothetical protein